MQEPTRLFGLQLFIAKASTADELDSGAGAPIVAVHPLFVARREKIVALGLQNAIPVLSQNANL